MKTDGPWPRPSGAALVLVSGAFVLGGCSGKRVTMPTESAPEESIFTSTGRIQKERIDEDCSDPVVRHWFTGWRDRKFSEYNDAENEKGIRASKSIEDAVSVALRAVDQCLEAYNLGEPDEWRTYDVDAEALLLLEARRKAETAGEVHARYGSAEVLRNTDKPLPLRLNEFRTECLKLGLRAAELERRARNLQAARQRIELLNTAVDSIFGRTRFALQVEIDLEEGALHLDSGEYAAALSRFDRAAEQSRAHQMDAQWSRAKFSQLAVFISLGQWNDVVGVGDEIISQAVRNQNHRDHQLVRLLQAQVLAQTEPNGQRVKVAIEELDELFARNEYRSYLPQAELELYKAIREGKPVDQRFVQAREWIRKGMPRDVRGGQDVLIKWGDCLSAGGVCPRECEAIADLELAAESFREVLKDEVDAQFACLAWAGMGRVELKRGGYEEAMKCFRRAMEDFERARMAGFATRGHRAQWSSRGARLYEEAVDCSYRLSDFGLAVAIMEESRARNFKDQLRGSAESFKFSDKSLAAKSELVHELESLKSALRLQEDAVATRGVAGTVKLDSGQMTINTLRRISELEKELLQVDRRLDREANAQAHMLNVADQADAVTFRVEEFQRELADDEIALIYQIGERASFVAAIDSRQTTLTRLTTDIAQLGPLVDLFRRNVDPINGDLGKSRAAARELGAVLIDPVEQRIEGRRRILVAAHGTMHYLPMSAVTDAQNRPLIERFAIVQLPSLEVLSHCRKATGKRWADRPSILSVGNPPTSMPPLPFAEQEARDVAGYYGPNSLVLVGQKATEGAVRDQLSHFDVLHFATHGAINATEPMESSLYFAADAKYDGRLTIQEVFETKIAANLVVLSACETGLTSNEGHAAQYAFGQTGDDLVGLSRAFLSAGAPTVVSSLWKVEDRSTADIMLQFHRNLTENRLDKAEALRLAQMHVRDLEYRILVHNRKDGTKTEKILSGDHPFLWAAFVLTGDWTQ